MAKWTIPPVYTQADLDRAVEEVVAPVVDKLEVACQIEIDRADRYGQPLYASGARACRNAIRAIAPNAPAILARIRAEEWRKAAALHEKLWNEGCTSGRCREAILARADKLDAPTHSP